MACCLVNQLENLKWTRRSFRQAMTWQFTIPSCSIKYHTSYTQETCPKMVRTYNRKIHKRLAHTLVWLCETTHYSRWIFIIISFLLTMKNSNVQIRTYAMITKVTFLTIIPNSHYKHMCLTNKIKCFKKF